MHQHYPAQDQAGPVFFDRGLPDIAGYLRMLNWPLPPHLVKAIKLYQYNRRVFIAPPWPEIFAQDQERKQTLDEAERTYEAMVATYTEYGYHLVEVRRRSVEHRVCFVIETMGEQAIAT